MTWPAESSRDRREGPPERQLASTTFLSRPAGAAPTAPTDTVPLVGSVLVPVERATRAGRFRSTDSPLRTTRPAKSDERTSAAIFTLRPIRTPRGITARLPTTVMPVLRRPGSTLFG